MHDHHKINGSATPAAMSQVPTCYLYILKLEVYLFFSHVIVLLSVVVIVSLLCLESCMAYELCN